eukprot:CAMPEP_0206508154 /NCGR_PEP_ID=MMETSP0324_2-20121206/58121_1 /ASSEMBLY_ACC=CAM_ASM_000836 /TAXON_ID=2866 /ORGANISM="Crypthecodinium cohnii, Strain Seligo" /LENGTH=72 /DNA_ID=CAMNT_0053998879 /DNA_START=9 /DNA_END=224 /DNA_ORIENTATION=+
MAILEERLAVSQAEEVAVVSVMGTFRTGKSFLLDIFLRYLYYWEARSFAGSDVSSAGRSDGLPEWWRASARN